MACATGLAAYRFDTLAVDVDGTYDCEAWDRGEELRVFGPAPSPSPMFEHLVESFSTVERPTWPVWLPGNASGSDDIARR